nr:MAG TPA: hypothetical protein [Caudoviricetes sp.]
MIKVINGSILNAKTDFIIITRKTQYQKRRNKYGYYLF